MVASTRAKNKLAHPAAPVMTETAKRKAGIKMKRRSKKMTKDDTIRELQAQLAALQNPNEASFSKEPLVCTPYLSCMDRKLMPSSLLGGVVHHQM